MEIYGIPGFAWAAAFLRRAGAGRRRRGRGRPPEPRLPRRAGRDRPAQLSPVLAGRARRKLSAALFGNVFALLRDNGRNFGLAFAAALPVHLGLVACLCAAGDAPDAGTFVVFGAAAIFTYVLALLSIPRLADAAGPDSGRRFDGSP